MLPACDETEKDNTVGGPTALSVRFTPDNGDNDGAADSLDNCPSTPGPVGGCPDADGDGVGEPADACPGVKGSRADGCRVPDEDGDGYASDAADRRLRDCNDDARAVHPGSPEVRGNDVDENCDGLAAFDQDGDNSDDEPGPDCDPTNRRIHPGARDKPGNRVDENCDGRTREVPAGARPRWRPCTSRSMAGRSDSRASGSCPRERATGCVSSAEAATAPTRPGRYRVRRSRSSARRGQGVPLASAQARRHRHGEDHAQGAYRPCPDLHAACRPGQAASSQALHGSGDHGAAPEALLMVGTRQVAALVALAVARRGDCVHGRPDDARGRAGRHSGFDARTDRGGRLAPRSRGQQEGAGSEGGVAG